MLPIRMFMAGNAGSPDVPLALDGTDVAVNSLLPGAYMACRMTIINETTFREPDLQMRSNDLTNW